ncbi:MAG: outer membrane lipoprotein chaperone LolA [Magnetococcales bacterium]|nr:outer membrane lipoprotein chaperone LolA [Magnetococcales bacterium]
MDQGTTCLNYRVDRCNRWHRVSKYVVLPLVIALFSAFPSVQADQPEKVEANRVVETPEVGAAEGGVTSAIEAVSTPLPKAVERLQSFLDRLQSIEAEFVQTVSGSDTAAAEKSVGSFKALKPKRFDWQYRKPYEQRIISDGETIWFYEPDLEQVTLAKATVLDRTPAAFLVAGGRLSDVFNWEVSLDEIWQEPMVHLSPREEGRFRRISITLHPLKDEILHFVLEDALGNRSQVRFINQKLNGPIPAAGFRFKIPEGMDVVDQVS